MDKWEYRTVLAKEVGVKAFSARKTAPRIDQFFNDLGRQGWEVAGFHFEAASTGGILALLKRRRS